MPKVGVIGSLVWDEIHGRDPGRAAVEEWGGIAYALAGFDAALADDWEIVPLIKVGRDLAGPAEQLLRSLSHVARSVRFIEVPAPNNRVVLRYTSTERRTERMQGGVPGWTWAELGPLVRDLDAIYVNFISGFELSLGTAAALRDGFRGLIYADLHSLFLAMGRDGMRAMQPLPDAAGWYRCFDLIQLNEDEMAELSTDPISLAAAMMSVGVSTVLVTLGARGAVYLTDGRVGGGEPGPLRTALIPSPAVDDADPTGCGDVFGATTFARILAGEPLDRAVAAGTRAGARNAGYRGATGLAHHLRGSLVSL
ncbi:MAG: carbohydrate kinase family protein [Gemmatimonadales bacterium]|nr:carbohydrate kinase family protein [Gemmatimonadales bacterium]